MATDLRRVDVMPNRTIERAPRELGLIVRGLWVLGPIVADLAAFYAGWQMHNPDLMGAAFVGAPIALTMTMAMVRVPVRA